MVHLCNCKGAINYAHFNCIKHWMKTKLIVLQNANKTVKTYYIQDSIAKFANRLILSDLSYLDEKIIFMN